MGSDEETVHVAHVGRLCALSGAAPFVIALIMLGVMVFLSSFNQTFPPEGAGSGGVFDDLHHISTQRFHATDMLRFRSGSESMVYDRQSLASTFTDISLLYHFPGEFEGVVAGQPLLTPDHLAGIRRFEDEIMRLSGYYVGGANGTGTHEVRCMLKRKAGAKIPTRNITQCTENIYEIPEGFECVPPRSVVDDTAVGQPFLPRGATRDSASAGRTQLTFGLPLPCFPNANLDEDGEIDPAFQAGNFSDWFGDVLMPYIEGEGRDELMKVGVSVRPWGNAALTYWFQKIINGDLAFVGVAAVAVAFVLLVMSRSLLLTVAGIFHILISYFSAWAVYIAFGYRVFPGLIQMVMFIILGIGADDVFVILDAWKRSHQERGSNINESLAIKMSVVIKRAATAMFVTTFTTFAAFAATAVSPVPAISAFGIYAAACVVIDYVYVITWFPAIMCIYHRFFEFRRLFPFEFSPFRCVFWELDMPETLKYHPLYEEAQRQKASRAEANAKRVAPLDDDNTEEPASPPRASVGVRKSGSVFGVDHIADKEEGDDLIPRNAPVVQKKGAARGLPGWIRAVDSRLAGLGWVGTAFVAAREEPYEEEMLDAGTLSFAERVFYYYIFPFIRLFRLPILIGYLILFVITAIYAVQLEPAGSNTIGLPDDQPLSQASRLLNDAFGSGSLQKSEVCFVYGVDGEDPIDRDGIDPNAEDYFGAPVFDTSFVAGPQLFEKVAGTCVRMIETADSFSVAQGKSPGDPGMRPAVDIEVATAQVRDVPCMALSFLQWARADRVLDPDASLDWASFRTPLELPQVYHNMNASEFAAAVELFVQTPAGSPYTSSVGYVRAAAAAGDETVAPERVRWLKDCYPVVMDPNKVADEGTVERWEAYVSAEQNVSGTKFFETSRMFVSVSSKNTMRESTILSAGISLVLVFVVMSLFSGSIPVAFLVTLCILQILVFVFAYMVWRGWPLDFIESVALTVLVGISVDFTVHYGVAYQEAEFKHRQRRLRFAMSSMGTSITSGALTTLSSAALLFAATFEFFTKFGEFMFITISLSWLVANTLFPALVYYFGPTGHCGDIHHGCASLLKRAGCCGASRGEGASRRGTGAYGEEGNEAPAGAVKVEDV